MRGNTGKEDKGRKRERKRGRVGKGVGKRDRD